MLTSRLKSNVMTRNSHFNRLAGSCLEKSSGMLRLVVWLKLAHVSAAYHLQDQGEGQHGTTSTKRYLHTLRHENLTPYRMIYCDIKGHTFLILFCSNYSDSVGSFLVSAQSVKASSPSVTTTLACNIIIDDMQFTAFWNKGCEGTPRLVTTRRARPGSV
jgi:hypothetical protein